MTSTEKKIRSLGLTSVAICYAPQDNKADGDATGWVDNFKKFMGNVLQEVTGEEITVKSYLADEFGRISERIAVYVISADLCEYPEEQLFNSTVQHFFKVSKQAIHTSAQPNFLRNLLGYELFNSNEQEGTTHEITDFFSEIAEKRFWMPLIDLCYDIKQALITDQALGNSSEPSTIYLADTTPDLWNKRFMVKRELQRHGYKVLPESPLPPNSQHWGAVIRRDLERSDLSLHLFGEEYGEDLEELDMTLPAFQNLVASKYAQQQSGLQRYLWIGNWGKEIDERQKTYLQRLSDDPEQLHGAELVQNRIEDFKSMVLNHLKKLKSSEKLEISDQEPTPSVYLMVDRRDQHEAEQISRWLVKRGYEVCQPAYNEAGHRSRWLHQYYLNHCQSLAVVYYSAKETWLQAKLLDIQKAPGMGREKSLDQVVFITDSQNKSASMQKQLPPHLKDVFRLMLVRNVEDEESLQILKACFNQEVHGDLLQRY